MCSPVNSTLPTGNSEEQIKIWYSDPTDGWAHTADYTEPDSPIPNTGSRTKRESPAGCQIQRGNYIDAFYEYQSGVSGDGMSCFRIMELTTSSFNDVEVPTSPVIHPERDRMGNNVHHVDPVVSHEGHDIALIDGRGNSEYKLGLATSARELPRRGVANPGKGKSSDQAMMPQATDGWQTLDVYGQQEWLFYDSNSAFVTIEEGSTR